MKSKHIMATMIILGCCACGGVAAEVSSQYAPYPAPDSGYVTDLAGLLTDKQEERLESWLYTCEKNKGSEIVVVTIQSVEDYTDTDNAAIEAFAAGLFNAYGIGNMPANDGVLLLVAVKDREARIELGAGYGHRRDSDADRIMQRIIVPQFKNGRYDKGIIEGTRALVSEFAGMRILSGWVYYAAIAGVVLLLPLMFSLFRNGKRGWGWICVGLIIILLLLIWVLTKKTIEHLPSGARAGGWGGGFGGGFSGGGGATGRW